MARKSIIACLMAVFSACQAGNPAPAAEPGTVQAPESAAGKTFVFGSAGQQQTVSRATAEGDIPHPVTGSSYVPEPITVPADPAEAARTYTRTGQNTARLYARGPESVQVWLTFESPTGGTCTMTREMPGASRHYSGIPFTMK